MAYKTLMTALTDPDHCSGVLRQLGQLAMDFDAHAQALCIGVDRSPTGYYQPGGETVILQLALEQAQTDAAALSETATAALEAAGVRFGAETIVQSLAGLGNAVAERTQFADLVVMPLPYGTGKGEDLRMSVEAALFGGRSPVLVLPDQADPSKGFRTIVVAWDESSEAMAAIRQSLPLLQAGDTVRIVMVEPPVHGPGRADPGGQLSRMLDRHGVSCEVDILSRTMPRTSDVLLRHVTDTGADLLVMGAYGHSRLREAILGGTTRNMLENAPIPVFMAH